MAIRREYWPRVKLRVVVSPEVLMQKAIGLRTEREVWHYMGQMFERMEKDFRMKQRYHVPSLSRPKVGCGGARFIRGTRIQYGHPRMLMQNSSDLYFDPDTPLAARPTGSSYDLMQIDDTNRVLIGRTSFSSKLGDLDVTTKVTTPIPLISTSLHWRRSWTREQGKTRQRTKLLPSTVIEMESDEVW